MGMAKKLGAGSWGVAWSVVTIVSALVAGQAVASPITIEFSSTSSSWGTARVVGTVPSVAIPGANTSDLPQVMAVRGFDASLGTLLSAHLVIDEVFDSRIFDHSKGSGLGGVPAYFQHSGRAFLSVQTYPALEAILLHSSTPDFNLNMFQTYSSVEDEDKTGVTSYVEIERHRSSTRSFDEVFTGAALASFVGSDAIGYFSNGSRYLSFEGEHTGHFLGGAVSSALNLPTGMSPGTKPGLGTVALLTLRLINAEVEEESGHELLYSDMHLALAAELAMTVRYTYEPVAASVPEPASMAFLVAGLTALAVRRRRHRW
jgi:hypothetical protein